jgi:membrane protease YdiL (CAAX protease family)
VTRRRRAELALLAGLAAYSLAARRLVPARARIPSNLGAAGTSLLLARAVGVSFADLGLQPEHARRGLRLGLQAAVPITVAAAAAVAWPRTREVLADPRITETTLREASFETLVRIPLETAIAEELLFRGSLLGIGLDNRTATVAVANSAVAFGLWHIPPTLESVRDSEGLRRATATGAVVATTTLAGVGLALLRLRARSVVAPIIVHAALNMTTYSGVWLTARSKARG